MIRAFLLGVAVAICLYQAARGLFAGSPEPVLLGLAWMIPGLYGVKLLSSIIASLPARWQAQEVPGEQA